MSEGHISRGAKFDITAAVVFRLGHELITDVVQALVELVKNSYDADASWVKVTIDSNNPNTLGRNYRNAVGTIVVEDNGAGMDLETITNSWLVIANSPKRNAKQRGVETSKGRTPIGDKGLGRLGVQRLGRNLEIFTRPKDGDTEYYVAFSWTDFEAAENLGDVEVTLLELPRSRRASGTTIIVSDLVEPQFWTKDKAEAGLQRNLSALLSPFREVRGFLVAVEINGKNIELAELAERVRETAMMRYTFEFDGQAFRVRGQSKLEYFLQTNNKEDRALLRAMCRSDDGRKLFEFLKSEAKKQRPPIFNLSSQDGWYVEFGYDRELALLGGVKRADGTIANPGAFHGSLDVLNLERQSKEHIHDRASDYRQIAKDFAGIRVYRDGFGVRVDDDWLGLGKQWTSGSSYYGLRPVNVIGYVAITAKQNDVLQETTSREGFLVTPYYENFTGLLGDMVKFTAATNEFFRRGVLQFIAQLREAEAGVSSGDDTEDVARRIGDLAALVTSQNKRLNAEKKRLSEVAARTTSSIELVKKELKTSPSKSDPIQKIVSHLEEADAEVQLALSSVESTIADVTKVLNRASELSILSDIVNRRWLLLREEVESFYESISLGLTVETLTHEIQNVADQLVKRGSQLLKYMHDRNAGDSSIAAFVEHVRSSAQAMRKQISHISPSLKYLRENRDVIDVSVFIEDQLNFYSERLQRKNITISAAVGKWGNFSVSINRGKLSQILGNFILNSEYWLQEAMRCDEIENGSISIEIDKPVIRISDNGRGVDLAVEGTLFEPFVTTKQTGQGRGLGLFVVQQLLDSEECTVILRPERNISGRRYVFELDMSGAVYD